MTTKETLDQISEKQDHVYKLEKDLRYAQRVRNYKRANRVKTYINFIKSLINDLEEKYKANENL